MEEAVARPYPLVTHRAQGTQVQRIDVQGTGYSKVVKMELRSLGGAPEEVAALANEAALRGARVLVIRNTVSDCVTTQRALEGTSGKDCDVLFGTAGVAAPHHSRYAADDRRKLDAAIEGAFGKHSCREGVVTVATQTVEQSLDIDADLMVTDLCPADVLLQRVGRLHRHPRSRPSSSRPEGCQIPRCIVLVPEERSVEPYIRGDGRASGPHGLGTVYPDLRILESTWRLIEGRAEWRIPEMNREVVELATHPKPLTDLVTSLGGRWTQHQNYVIALRGASTAKAGILLLPREKHFGEVLFPTDPGELIKTRLGEGDRIVEFETEMASPFGSSYQRLDMPHFYAPDAAADAEPENVTDQDGVLRFEFGGRAFTYTRLGLHPADAPYLEGAFDG
jgi:CRISPR-associated endonuclease/helicase Cas3